MRGLLNADPTLAVPSAAVAAHLLRGNPAAKAHLLTLPVEAPPATGGALRHILPTLAATVTGYFAQQGAHRVWQAFVCVALAPHASHTLLLISAAAPEEERARPLATAAAMLLAVWLADCPAAVSALLNAPGVVETFVAVIAERCVWTGGCGAAGKRAKQNCGQVIDLHHFLRPPLCDDFVRGFAAVLLGECLLFCGDDVQVGAVLGCENAVFGNP